MATVRLEGFDKDSIAVTAVVATAGAGGEAAPVIFIECADG